MSSDLRAPRACRQQRPATAHNTRTIRANLAYVRPETEGRRATSQGHERSNSATAGLQTRLLNSFIGHGLPIPKLTVRVRFPPSARPRRGEHQSPPWRLGAGSTGQLSNIRRCSMSRRRCWCRSTRTSSPPPSLSLRTRRAPGPRQRVGAVRAGHGRQHAKQFDPQRRQPPDILLDLGDVPPQQARSWLAWTRAGIANG